MDLRYPNLNLPPLTNPRFETGEDGLRRIFDPLRGKFVALTPEEWVRAHFTAFLTDHLGYPAALMANEVSLTLNGTGRRCDTVLFTREGLHPRMIIEYKAPHIEINRKVFDQIARYNMVLRAPYLIVSNGLHHYCLKIDYSSPQTPQARFLPDLPPYSEL